MKCSKYFGAKWCGFIKSESILAPKGASRFKTQNIRYDNSTVVERSPYHLNVKGLSLATAAGTELRKWRNKKIKFYSQILD